MADQYVLRVTAGSSRDVASHQLVAVNTAEPVSISTDLIDARLNVRVQNYHGLPRNSPSTSPYFSAEPHAYNNDQYSIALSFRLKKPPELSSLDRKGDQENDDDANPVSATDSGDDEGLGVGGADLQFGNDFDHPIRDRLPPGFGTAMSIVRWWIDPGLEGDVYADEPFLYGPALSSFNALRVGGSCPTEIPSSSGDGEGGDGKAAKNSAEKVGLWVEEGGGDEAGLQSRRSAGAPDDAKGRMKWALRADSKAKWIWEYDREYAVDFYNPYLDFNSFALRLPGFTLPIIKYWDGQGLRYVLRNRKTGDLYLAVTFSLYLKEDVNDDGSLKPGVLEAQKRDGGKTKTPAAAASSGGHDEHDFDEDKAIEEARRKLSGVDVGDETRDDDVD